MSQISTRKAKLSDGIIRQNAVLMSGMFTGPVIGAASDLQKACAVCFVFSLVTLISVGLCRLLPKKIAFAVRIVLYALTASVIYIPVMLLAEMIFPMELLNAIGLYLTVIVINPFILSKTESRFFLRPTVQMFKDVIGFIIGFDLSCLLLGVIRDILTDNMLWNMRVTLPFQIPAMGTVFGGLILLGVLAGLCRALYNRFGKKRQETASARHGRK